MAIMCEQMEFVVFAIVAESDDQLVVVCQQTGAMLSVEKASVEASRDGNLIAIPAARTREYPVVKPE
jgi:hypothetical protein